MLDKKKPVRPLCLTRKGCPYADVAPDRKLGERVHAFLQAEMLMFGGGYGKLTERLIADSGLEQESAATILEAKRVLQNYQDWKAKSEKTRQKARSGGR
jgi:hypothetical protein